MRAPQRLLREARGQGLLEAAFLLPTTIILVFNAVSIGYMFCVLLNLTTAVRQGAQYSIRGTTTVLEAPVPVASVVSSLVYDNINTSVPAATAFPTNRKFRRQLTAMFCWARAPELTAIPPASTADSYTFKIAPPRLHHHGKAADPPWRPVSCTSISAGRTARA